MHKTVKSIKAEKYTYQLGYELVNEKIFPCIEILDKKDLVAWGYLDSEDTVAGSFYYDYDYYYNTDCWGSCNTIKEMFNKLRTNIYIPIEIENEYENIFLMYKLNDFNEL